MSRANGFVPAFAAIAAGALVAGCGADSLSNRSTAEVQIDIDDIAGVVTGGKGPEAGVWVIAETDAL